MLQFKRKPIVIILLVNFISLQFVSLLLPSQSSTAVLKKFSSYIFEQGWMGVYINKMGATQL